MSNLKQTSKETSIKRSFNISDFKVSGSEKEDDFNIEGHAAVFGQRTSIGNYFYEVIERGAFDECDFSDVSLFINHDMNMIPLARSKEFNNNSTMKLQVDEKGLYIRAKLDIENNLDSKTLYSSIKRGDIDGMSFAFIISDESWENLDLDMPLRRIKKISKVFEVSAVNSPAYTSTDISARDKDALEKERIRLSKRCDNELDLVKLQYEFLRRNFLDMDLVVLRKMLESKKEKRKLLDDKVENSTNIEEVRSAIENVKELNKEIEDLSSFISLHEDDDFIIQSRSVEDFSKNNFNPIATFRNVNNVSKQNDEDKYSTLAYRNAFKDYVISGVPIPEEYRYNQEQRSNELTMVGDVGAVIPTNLLNKVIEDMAVEGKILARINSTTYQGGVDIPISELDPSATWLESENVVSNEQKAVMNAKLSFGYHVLEARISVGLLTSTVTLNMFENIVIKQLKKAMIRAIETAIISGTGVGQPRGITTYTLPSEQVVKMDTNSIGKVSTWAGVESKIPESEEDSVIYMMNKATWEKYLNGMTDSTGQKIGLGRINEKGQKILNGREVLTCDKLPSFDSASDNDIFGVVVDLSKYMLNSNLSMYYKKYFDDDKNKYVHKSIMIVDGKMPIGEVNAAGRSKKLVGAKGLIYLTKGTALMSLNEKVEQ